MRFKKIHIMFFNFVFLVVFSLIAVNCESILPANNEIFVSGDNYVSREDRLVINLDGVKRLRYEGGYAVIKDSSVPNDIIIARTEKDHFVVAAGKTENNLPVRFNSRLQLFEAMSLGKAKYNLEGQPASGVAEGELKIYNFTVNQNKMTISLN